MREDLTLDKNSAPVEALGVIDELSGWIEALAAMAAAPARDVFAGVLNDLAGIARLIRDSDNGVSSTTGLDRLQQFVDQHGDLALKSADATTFPPFVHLARSVCQRAERSLLTFSELEAQVEGALSHDRDVNAESGAVGYLNNLSRLLRQVEDRVRPAPYSTRT